LPQCHDQTQLTNLDTNRIAELLEPFLTDSPHLNKDGHSDSCYSGNSPHPENSCHSERSEESGFGSDATLSQRQLEDISTYIDLLLRWNARINLTAIRQPEEIVTRHFGESLFAARHLFPKTPTWEQPAKPAPSQAEQSLSRSVIDLGSGAGFPGIPIKIWAPEIALTLIESNQKKATFLREVTRALTLTNINVFSGRAEDYANPGAEVVTLRAVERFESILPTASDLVAPSGRLALLISEAQLPSVKILIPTFTWTSPIPIAQSSSRILALGIREP
jgi:16S rRNA (guanine527-N7)-methyltransferase